MPTPSPINTPMKIAKSGTGVRCEIRVMRPAPMPTPATATAIGSPIASTEPKARISTTIANARPTSSDSGGAISTSASPPNSIWSPGTSGASAAISAPTLPVSVKSRSAARLSAANATRLSPLIWVALSGPAYGLETMTPSIWATSANIASIGVRTAGSSMPVSERKTIEPLVPLPKPPKWASRASNPRRASESGMSNEASKVEPMAATAPKTSTTTATHAATTRHGCRKHQPPIRASTLPPPVTSS